MKTLLKIALTGLLTSFGFAQDAPKPAEPKTQEAAKEVTVIMSTSMGDIHIELDSKNAPKTVENFLKYVDDKFYDGTVFHRVMNGFMIQGGGFKEDDGALKKQKTKPAIKNESAKTSPNNRGTISMARLPDPHSATTQFFINVVDNTNLNYPHNGGGYATFGKVTEGMEVVDQIKAVETGLKNGMANVPKETITIKSVKRSK